MKICIFGEINPKYSRYSNLIEGLIKNNVKVYLCNYNFTKKITSPFSFIIDILKEFKHLSINLLKIKLDYIIIGYPILKPIWFTLFLKKDKIILDPFISFYNTAVNDRKQYLPNSLKAKFLYLYEKKAFSKSTLILADTKAHALFFSRLYNVDYGKFVIILVGSNRNIYHPIKNRAKKNEYIVGFYGKFQPLHGIEYIVQSAKILEKFDDISFEILGGTKNNHLFTSICKLIKDNDISNVKLIPPIHERKLKNFISKTDIQLGIFGDSIKAKIVIPNKIYSALAMGKPLITEKSFGISELLSDKKNCLLCNFADPVDLANKITLLYKNSQLSKKLAKNAFKLYLSKCTPEKIVLPLIRIIKKN